MNVSIKHKEHGWIAAETWSVERAEMWLDNFNPGIWDDKTLTANDFTIVIDGGSE